MNLLVTYEDGNITLNTYRAPSSTVTDVPDILNAIANHSEENLTATINNEQELREIEALV